MLSSLVIDSVIPAELKGAFVSASVATHNAVIITFFTKVDSARIAECCVVLVLEQPRVDEDGLQDLPGHWFSLDFESGLFYNYLDF